MRSSKTTTPTVVALSLAVALALTPASPAQADNLGQVATSSVLWDSVDSTTGVFTGGTPQMFDPAHGGWRGPAFQTIGEFGIEFTPATGPIVRHSFSAWNELITLEQGGDTSLELNALIVSDSLSRNLVTPVITASANAVKFDIGVEEFWEDSLDRKRLFFFADLAAGSAVRYENLGPQTLLATDLSGISPAVVLHVESSTGQAYWGGPADYQQPVTDGVSELAGYVTDINATSVDLTVYAFIIDGDPCADEQMRNIAQTIAADLVGSFGTVLDTPSQCLAANSWTALTDSAEPQLVTIDVDPRVVTPEGSTRRFAIGGQPEFLGISVDESAQPVTAALSLTDQATAGVYPLTVSSWLETGTSRSQPMTQLVSLTLSDPPPPPAPEPEPEPEPEPQPEPEPTPEPEPVVEPEPEVVPEPEPAQAVDEEPPAATVTVASDASRDTRSQRKREDIIVIDPNPLPVTPALPPRVSDAPTEVSELTDDRSEEPRYQLQESTPATPLPAPPHTEQALPVSHEPATTLWTTWWLWVIVGLALIWWAWLGWQSRRSVDEGM